MVIAAKTLVGSPELSYGIDAEDRIVNVSDGWNEFATLNDGHVLLPPEIFGTFLWDWIADNDTRQVYHNLVQRVREARTVVRFEFRCDSPTEQRLLQMEIVPEAKGHVTFRTSTVSCHLREPFALLDKNSARSDSVLKICGWCARIKSKDSWLELEQAVWDLRLFDAPRLPKLSHGICPTCYEAMLNMVDNPDALALQS